MASRHARRRSARIRPCQRFRRRTYRDRLRRRSRARRAEDSRGAVREARAIRASNARRVFNLFTRFPAKPFLNPRNRAIHRARVAQCRRVLTASRSIVDGERSFFRSRAFVVADNVPVRGNALNCHGLELKGGEVTASQLFFKKGDKMTTW